MFIVFCALLEGVAGLSNQSCIDSKVRTKQDDTPRYLPHVQNYSVCSLSFLASDVILLLNSACMKWNGLFDIIHCTPGVISFEFKKQSIFIQGSISTVERQAGYAVVWNLEGRGRQNTVNNHLDQHVIFIFAPRSNLPKKILGSNMFVLNIWYDFLLCNTLLQCQSSCNSCHLRKAEMCLLPWLNGVIRCSLTWKAEQGHLFDSIREHQSPCHTQIKWQ